MFCRYCNQIINKFRRKMPSTSILHGNSYIIPSITVIYYAQDRLQIHYGKLWKNRRGLELKGITSFSGYLTSIIEEMMIRYEAFAKHAPLIGKVAVDQNRVKDNKWNRIAKVLLKDGELQCLLDKRSDSSHVGFVYSHLSYIA